MGIKLFLGSDSEKRHRVLKLFDPLPACLLATNMSGWLDWIVEFFMFFLSGYSLGVRFSKKLEHT